MFRAVIARLLVAALAPGMVCAPKAAADIGDAGPGGGIGGNGRLNPDVNVSAGSSLLFMCPGVGAAANVIGGGGGYCDWGFSVQGHY